MKDSEIDPIRIPSGRVARPYNVAVVREILTRHSAGETLRSICMDAHMPERDELTSWMLTNPEMLPDLDNAHRAFAASLVDEVIDIIDSEPDPQRAKVRLACRQWVAKCYDPRKYADRVDVNISSESTIIDAISASRERRESMLRLMRDQGPIRETQLIELQDKTMATTTDYESGGCDDEPQAVDPLT